MDTINVLDVVALTEALPDEGLRRGEIGTVVEQWADGVFEVEFSDDSGRAYAFVAVPAGKLIKLRLSRDEGKSFHKLTGKINATAPSKLESWACSSRATLAVLITDIVGSSTMIKKKGIQKWGEVYSQHSSRVVKLTSEYDCQKVKDTGDGFIIVFRTSMDALSFAVKLHEDTGNPEIKVRSSIHVGVVRIETDDIRGGTVNFTSRISGWTKKPWIILSNTAKEHVIEELGIEASDVGFLARQADLKDYDRQTLWLAFIPQAKPSSGERERKVSPPPQWWLRIRETFEKEMKR